jgi:hypothetical protein
VGEVAEAERVLLVLDRDDPHGLLRKVGKVATVHGGVQTRAVPGLGVEAGGGYQGIHPAVAVERFGDQDGQAARSENPCDLPDRLCGAGRVIEAEGSNGHGAGMPRQGQAVKISAHKSGLDTGHGARSRAGIGEQGGRGVDAQKPPWPQPLGQDVAAGAASAADVRHHVDALARPGMMPGGQLGDGGGYGPARGLGLQQGAGAPGEPGGISVQLVSPSLVQERAGVRRHDRRPRAGRGLVSGAGRRFPVASGVWPAGCEGE